MKLVIVNDFFRKDMDTNDYFLLYRCGEDICYFDLENGEKLYLALRSNCERYDWVNEASENTSFFRKEIKKLDNIFLSQYEDFFQEIMHFCLYVEKDGKKIRNKIFNEDITFNCIKRFIELEDELDVLEYIYLLYDKIENEQPTKKDLEEYEKFCNYDEKFYQEKERKKREEREKQEMEKYRWADDDEFPF